MKHLQKLLAHPLTAEQLEILAAYPSKGIEKAITKLERRGGGKSFNYFMRIVKDESPPPVQERARQQEPQTYIRELEPEDPLEAIVRICTNLSETTIDKRGWKLTPEMKQRVALKDPWFDKLTTEQTILVLTIYPFYTKIVGLGEQYNYWQQLHYKHKGKNEVDIS